MTFLSAASALAAAPVPRPPQPISPIRSVSLFGAKPGLSAARTKGAKPVASAAADDHPGIDAAYHAKYDRYGPQIVNTVVGDLVRDVTIRLEPRSS
jgi:hypothetical protein